jgi:steroid 5-alpha reductase family enzyme
MKEKRQGSGLPAIVSIFLPIFFLYNYPGLQSAVIICVYQMGLIFIHSTFYGHLSFGDGIWSTAPIMYAFLLNDWSPRGTLQFLLILLWGVRLSYNIWRKGGYRGLEDYRWVVVKQRFKTALAWELFRILFLCCYQMVINFELALPVYYTPAGPLHTFDYILGALGLFFIVYQLIADQQQWDFQSQKKQGGKEENKIGFVRTGLWRYSRHPNYFAELGLWWSVYGLTYGFNWSVLGVLQMTLLFQRVIKLTEKISSSKYDQYAAYQKTTSQLIPLPPKH